MEARTGKPTSIPGEVGSLEASLHQVTDAQALAVVCHPHPLHAGSMNNKVVMAVTWALVANRISVIRFNYRGVGKSEGEYGHITGEVSDAQAVASWAQKHLEQSVDVWAGFSFGSYIAAKQVQNEQRLIMIAPPVTRMPFSEVDPPKNSLLIMNHDDEVVAFEDVSGYVQSGYQGDVMFFQQGGHFFHGRTICLKNLISAWLGG